MNAVNNLSVNTTIIITGHGEAYHDLTGFRTIEI
jgi:hypothetical protein